MIERTEFGYARTTCACENCVRNCKFMPGFLIPADLDRMIPPNVDPFAWAETNLLASPGAIVMKNGQLMRIPTLVPAVKPDGSCIHLQDNLCQIHAVSPFGCAFFDCKTKGADPCNEGIMVIFYAWGNLMSLYRRIWIHLNGKGLNQLPGERLRARMRAKMYTEELGRLVSQAEREVEDLRSQGWTKNDFAQALKALLDG